MKECNSEECAKLLGSLLLFTRTFFEIRTGREFRLSSPVNRESHFITICKSLTRILKGYTKRLIIQIPPRYGKSELLIHFVAWSLAHYPNSNFIYVSYSKSLAKKQTQTIRDIISLKEYKELFDIRINEDSSAKDDFIVSDGGSVYAVGSGGTITGRGAGIMGCSDFGGAVIIDDIHKPDEVTSETMREGIKDWYYNTLQSRLNNGVETPIIIIGQLLHEDDLSSHLTKNGDWETLIIPALDNFNNPLYPEIHSAKDLLKMKEENPYIFSLQYQQLPVPSGGGIFKKEWFIKTRQEPKILISFITVDTAETDKEYNDATVFSFWGVYKIDQLGVETDVTGLHWIDCVEIRVQPKDLEKEFVDFYLNCLEYKVKPSHICIEKKSTGTTLISTLSSIRGLDIIPIERKGFVNNKVNSKTNRFLESQPYVSKKLISIPINGRHTDLCIEHMSKITANKTHRFDDIADTMCDAIYLTFINKFIEQKIDSTVSKVQNNMLLTLGSSTNSLAAMIKGRS